MGLEIALLAIPLLCCLAPAILIILQLLGAVLGITFNILGIITGLLGSIFGLFFDILTGGPLAWCGCFVLLMGCGACSMGMFIVFQVAQTCGTPEAVNFCQFLSF